MQEVSAKRVQNLLVTQSHFNYRGPKSYEELQRVPNKAKQMTIRQAVKFSLVNEQEESNFWSAIMQSVTSAISSAEGDLSINRQINRDYSTLCFYDSH